MRMYTIVYKYVQMCMCLWCVHVCGISKKTNLQGILGPFSASLQRVILLIIMAKVVTQFAPNHEFLHKTGHCLAVLFGVDF